MNIIEYVTSNWDSLPKSHFNDVECVIVVCINDSNEGWGNHSYEGIGITKEGVEVWCYSSGCSCSGSCGVTHHDDFKVLEANGLLDPELDFSTIDFDSMQVGFSDYD